MLNWYEAARKHVKTVLPASTGVAFADLMSAWFAAGAPGAAGAQPAATTTVNGTVKKAATVAAPTDAATALSSLQALIISMRAAGQIV